MKENLLLLEDFLEPYKTTMIFNHITAVSKNVYFDVLDDVVNNCNKTFHRTIKIKPVYVLPDSYAEYNVDSTKKNPKFKIDDHVKKFKIQKNIFAKGHTSNWSEEVFVISKIPNKIPWTNVISDLNVVEVVVTSY